MQLKQQIEKLNRLFSEFRISDCLMILYKFFGLFVAIQSTPKLMSLLIILVLLSPSTMSILSSEWKYRINDSLISFSFIWIILELIKFIKFSDSLRGFLSYSKPSKKLLFL